MLTSCQCLCFGFGATCAGAQLRQLACAHKLSVLGFGFGATCAGALPSFLPLLWPLHPPNITCACAHTYTHTHIHTHTRSHIHDTVSSCGGRNQVFILQFFLPRSKPKSSTLNTKPRILASSLQTRTTPSGVRVITHKSARTHAHAYSHNRTHQLARPPLPH